MKRLRAINPMFTTFWLLDLIDRTDAPEIPHLRYAEGDELILCEVRYPLAAGTTDEDIGAALEECPEFRRAGETSWNWVSQEKPAAASDADAHSQGSLSIESWHEDGALVRGHLVSGRPDPGTLRQLAGAFSTLAERCCQGYLVDASASLRSRLNQSSKSWPGATSPSHSSSISLSKSTAPSSTIRWIGTTAACSMRRFPRLEAKTPRAAAKTESGRGQGAGGQNDGKPDGQSPVNTTAQWRVTTSVGYGQN